MTEQTFGGYGERDEVPASAPTEIYLEPGATAPAPERQRSLLDDLREEAEREISEPLKIPVLGRKGWAFEFNTEITAGQIKRYNAYSKGAKKKQEDGDSRIGNAHLIAEHNVGIYREVSPGEWEAAETETGSPLTVKSNEFLVMNGETLGKADVVRAIITFLKDVGVTAMGQALMRAGGWADELEPVDPTNG